MIERNLGNLERVVRLALGLGLLVMLALQPSISGIDWFVAIISLFLILNGVFCRCYLWFILDLNSHDNSGNRASSQCGGIATCDLTDKPKG